MPRDCGSAIAFYYVLMFEMNRCQRFMSFVSISRLGAPASFAAGRPIDNPLRTT
ncbi:hypothetical protein PATSB16_31830 [Pandoraea thiooxydans]|nr:hypothetical protein PATSB16_31830 [Pandoraea thiooxydans]